MSTSAEAVSGSSLDNSSGSESLSLSFATTRQLISELKDLILPKANATNKGKAQVLTSNENLLKRRRKKMKKQNRRSGRKEKERDLKSKKKRYGRKN